MDPEPYSMHSRGCMGCIPYEANPQIVCRCLDPKAYFTLRENRNAKP